MYDCIPFLEIDLNLCPRLNWPLVYIQMTSIPYFLMFVILSDERKYLKLHVCHFSKSRVEYSKYL